MASVSISSDVNFDHSSMLGLLNGELTTINGAKLTIDSDNRYSQNACVFGNISIDQNFGGSIFINGKDVWWIPFDASSGLVPSLGTVGINDITGSLGGGGEFLGVYSSLGSNPLASGASMPASGFIKLRKKTSNFSDNEVITFSNGAMVTVNSVTGGERGWLNIVGTELSQVTIPRAGSFTADGDWFLLGQTNGLDDQTFSFPIIDICPGIQVEVSPGSDIYEWWPNAGARWGTATQFVSTDERGKYFGQDISTGIITIAQRTINQCGFKPVSGCKVRIPNLIFSSSNSTNWNLNTQHATATSKYKFYTNNAGAISIKNVCSSWYLTFVNPFSINLENTCYIAGLNLANPSSRALLNNSCHGIELGRARSVQVSSINSGTLIAGCKFSSYLQTTTSVHVNGGTDLEIVNSSLETFAGTTTVTRTAAGYSFVVTQVDGISVDGLNLVGSGISFATCFDGAIKNVTYSDAMIGTTTSSYGVYAIRLTSTCKAFNISYLFNRALNEHPYMGYLNIGLNSFDLNIFDVGTFDEPLNLGTINTSRYFIDGIANNTKMKRVYTVNAATSFCNTNNATKNVEMVNCWGDYLDQFIINSINMSIKGCRGRIGTSGRSSVYGTQWSDSFDADTTGKIYLMMNESTVETASNFQLISGTPKFSSTGILLMYSLGDEVMFEMPYYSLGHSSFKNITPTISGGNTGNMEYKYSINTGSTWSDWKILNASNLTSESISPTIGFKLRLKIKSIVAGSNTITCITIQTDTTVELQKTIYPEPKDSLVKIENIVSGSRVYILNQTTNQEIYNSIVTGDTLEIEYSNGDIFSVGDVALIRIAHNNGTTSKLPFDSLAVAGESGWSVYANQEDDLIYSEIGVNATSIGYLTANYVNNTIEINSSIETDINVQDIYSWTCLNRTTENGIKSMFYPIFAEDFVNYKTIVTNVDLKLFNLSTEIVKIIGGRLYRSNGTTVIYPSSNSIHLDPDRVFIVRSGSSLTDAQSAMLVDISTKVNSSDAIINSIDSTMNSVESKVDEIHKINGLDSSNPMTVTQTTRTVSTISQEFTGDGIDTTTITRL